MRMKKEVKESNDSEENKKCSWKRQESQKIDMRRNLRKINGVR